jgi:hypothetical protein
MSTVGKGKKDAASEGSETPTGPVPAPVASHPSDKLKIAFPDTFNGDRKKLKSFLIQTELWMAFNAKHFAFEVQQVLWAVALLRGPASDWIANYLTDYMAHRAADGRVTTTANQGTKDIFISWSGFVKQLRANFGDVDARRNAVRALEALRQRGSAVSYTAEFQQHATLTNWGDEAICDQYYKGLKDHVKDEISRSDKPDDLKEMIEMAQKIDNRYYERQLERKGGGSSNHHWSQKRTQKKSHWPQPMELDATFKSSGRPRNPNKERQLKERLCFNCNKPGHMARDCKQPKKGNNGRKFGKQLNATWVGRGGYNELAATSSNVFDWEVEDWEVDDEDPEEDESSSKEGELTEAGERELREFEESARQVAFKEQLPAIMADMRKRILRKGTTLAIAVPPASHHWQGTKQDWEATVRAMRCRPGYPQEEEPRGANYTQKEATDWLMRKIADYEARDGTLEDASGTGFMSEEEGNGLEQRNVAEIDHPWHQYVDWEDCYTNECSTHYSQKEKNQLFPRAQLPVYYSWQEMKEITQRRRSTGQLHRQGESPQGQSPNPGTPVWETHPHLLRQAERESGPPPGPPSDSDGFYPSDESKN